ncbi:NAD(P)H-binding protein [Neorhizobium galegae]|uniref:NAD(P)H-binding protein n=1 Tax=Neorhizobium galegae TaxID=399 RepID=UPI0006225B51|nr:NAD(P)H-binding protein [Neorhizobium galegae]CDZ64820.1 NmrA family protein [Neorhizobium galegae bv. orientalis]KAB1119783.1 NAD(P)H-binding protein [Neorhizobium galegae]MCQ1575145.1 NAD(P)H-binding protein [Neorhizobium galegae]MCQ1809028.1 NAD(P)H-binding protein [Neorhizobium galegae]MCQ1838648.1 NAD(P)H-binding protein [Neorhizobium galegae]
MYTIVGAAGKVGYSTALSLRKAGVAVRAILRDESKAGPLSEIGCDIALADLQDTTALRWAIANADAVQVILPPDGVGEMRRSIESLAGALEQARPNRVLAISDYGAHVSEDIGMPTLFHIFEERLRQLEMPKVFLRSAEHMQGWGLVIPLAIAAGILPSFHDPVEMEFPTISAPDLGLIAADLLLHPDAGTNLQVVHAEGSRRYSANDVAATLSQLLGRAVTAQAVPRLQWQENFERFLSESAAKLLVDLYDAHNKGGLVDVETNGAVRYGTTSLIDALRPLVPTAVDTN